MAKEKCVLCGCETYYDIETDVNYRIGYIEGVGQLCKDCNNEISNISNSRDNKSENFDIYDNNNV